MRGEVNKVMWGLIVSLTMTGGASAGEQFVDASGIANFGYDVVAYHTELTATPGQAAFAESFNGATFWFADATNKALFAADPARYAPAYDGHCAFALASDKKLTVDPQAFSIVDPATNARVDPEIYDPSVHAGVLYLNYSPDVNAKFNADIGGLIAKADYAWEDCLELRPAARPDKGLRDLLPGRRAKSCPTG